MNLLAVLARALADFAAIGVLGLAVIPALDTARHRDELADRAEPALAAVGLGWLLTELIRLLAAAAQAAAVPLTRLSVAALRDFTVATTPGRAGLLSVLAAALVSAVVLVAPRSAPTRIVIVGLAATGIAARAVSGHLADSMPGAVAVAVHALAAALWCGLLAAMVLTLRHRGQWARVLPRFSQLSLLCVAALLASGTVGALLVIRSPASLFTTTYGRLLVAKIVLAAVLVGLGWRNRTVWLPAARAHRVDAAVSRRRSLTELAVMATALMFAAALVVTG